MLSQYGKDNGVPPLMFQLYLESLRSLGGRRQKQQQTPTFPSTAGAQPFTGIHPLTLSPPNFLVNSPPTASSAAKNSPPVAPVTSMVTTI